VAMIAISAAAKKPFARIKLNIRIGSSQILLGIMDLRLLFLSGAKTGEKGGRFF
jgi:hypothetical protein